MMGNGAGTSDAAIYNFGGGVITAGNGSYGLLLGVNASSSSTFNMTGGSLNAASLYIGRTNHDSINSTNNLFSQSAGTATVGTLYVGGGIGNSGVGSTNVSSSLSLTGGQFTATNFNVLGGTAAGNVATIYIGGTANVTLPAFPTPSGGTVNLTMNGGTLTSAASSANYISGLTNAYAGSNGANFYVPSGQSVTVGQIFQDLSGQHGTLAQFGGGQLSLTGANTYSGGTNIAAGTVEFTTTAAMPSSGTVSVQNGATLAVAAGGTNQFTATGSGSGSIAGLLLGVGGQNGPVTWNSGAILGIDTGSDAGGLTYSGVIADISGMTGLGLTKLGANGLVLTNSENYTGKTTISAGTLAITGTGSLGNGNYNQNISLTQAASGSLIYSSSANQTFSGQVLTTGVGPTLVQNGPGTLTLTGADNAYLTLDINSGLVIANKNSGARRR